MPRLKDVAAAVVAFVCVLGLGLDDGGFFERSWTIAAVALLWVVALALLLATHVEVAPIEWAWIALLAAFVGWTALSMTWSASPDASLLEVRRGIVYVAAAAALVLVAAARSGRWLVVAVWAAIAALLLYALGRYLLQPTFRDVYQGALLSEPVGYANTVGILAGLASVLAVGLAAGERHRILRPLAFSSLAPLAAALVLSSSRAAALATLVGLAVLFAVATDRLEVIGASLAAAPVVALVVVLSARSGLDDAAAATASSARASHGLAAWIAACAAGLALAPAVADRATRALATLPARARVVGGAALAAAAVACAAVAVVVWGRSFFATGFRPAYWQVAWDDYTAHPWLGSGGGTFGDYWLRFGDLALAGGALDAHNLYLETLAEVGPLGLLLLLAALTLPLAATARVRGQPLVPAAAGAYVTLLAHAALDWDWEMPVAILAGLACSASILVAHRCRSPARRLSWPARAAALAAALALAGFALAAHLL